MMNLSAAIIFAIGVVLPNFLLILLGFFLRRYGQIDSHFCAQASKLVFNFGLPLLLFVNLVNSQIAYTEQLRLIGAGIVITLILFALAEYYAWRYIQEIRDKGVFVQGVFRGNMAISGLAFVFNAYGQKGVAEAAGYVGILTIIFNVLSVITLSRSNGGSWYEKARSIVWKIISNPLIVAIVSALLLNRMRVNVAEPVLLTCRYVANLSLPLALICAGATFNLRHLANTSDISLRASLMRLLIAPPLAVMLGGVIFGLREQSLGILFLMITTPTAAASYIMAKAMGGNDVAAANIIALTTFGAIFTAAAGLAFLTSIGWT